MDYKQQDSSGTDDDYPPSFQNHGHRGGYMNGNGRTNGGDLLHSDIENQIRKLELEAYSSVLRAFKAQSDAITWEKEGVITDLRKELRISDEEHKSFLSKVNTEDTIKRIREWRQIGGIHSGLLNNAYSNDALTSPTSSHKRSRTSQAIPTLPLGSNCPTSYKQAITPIKPSSSAAKKGSTSSGAKSKKPKLCPSIGTNGRGQVAPRSSSAAFAATRPFQPGGNNESLIGRKVMTRWPADNNFYKAVITGYNAKEGLHSLVYDINTENETWEWVNLREIAAGDICWAGDGPDISDIGLYGPSLGTKKPQRFSGIIDDTSIGGKGASEIQSKDYIQNGHINNSFEDIEILNTETLLKEVESVLEASFPNPLDIEKAKKMLREHEQSLIDAIARLDAISDGESAEGEDKFLQRPTMVDN